MCYDGPDEARNSFDDAIRRLDAGDNDAAAEIFRRFSRRLRGLAQSRLSQKAKQKVDPEDITQSVFRSFFVKQRVGRFQLDGWEGLWALLVVITLRKCGRRVATYAAACRDLRREMPARFSADDTHDAWDTVTRDPTPQEAAELAETLEHLMQGMDERSQNILSLRLQGYSILEISERVGRTERTVHRALAGIRQRLERMQDIDEQSN